MTNGKVLIAAGPVDGVGGSWLTPTYFFEFDGSSLNRVNDPPNATNVPYIGRMLLLPTWQILFAAQTNEIYAYNYFPVRIRRGGRKSPPILSRSGHGTHTLSTDAT